MTIPQVWSEDRSQKQCSNCLALKPPDDFHRRKLKSGGFGFQSWCKACARAKALEFANSRYAGDPGWREQKLAKDREAGARKRAAHRAANPRVLLTPEERLERQRASGRKSAARPERKEAIRLQAHNYRVLKKAQAEGEPITEEVWAAIVEKHGRRCFYCKVETPYLEIEHIDPISRGGEHSAANIVPACRACNTSKNNRTLDEWILPTEPQPVQRSGGRRGGWKLSEEQVLEIRRRRAAGESVVFLAAEFGLQENYVSGVCTGRHRKDIGGELTRIPGGRSDARDRFRKLTDEQVAELRLREEDGEKRADLAAEYGISVAYVGRLVRRSARSGV